MATRTWNSAGSTDMNDGSNYSPTGPLLTTDDIVFDGTSVVNATATAALSVQSITVAATYTGDWDQAGFALTTSGSISFTGDGSNTLTIDGATTVTGDGDITIDGSSWDTIVFDVTTTILDLKGDNTLTMDSSVGTFWIGTLTCAYEGKTTTIDNSNQMYPRNITLGDGTLNLIGVADFGWSIIDANDFVTSSNHSITGTGDFLLRFAAPALPPINIPKINGSGASGTFWLVCFNAARTHVGNHVGDFTWGGDFDLYSNSAATGTLEYNTGNYNFNVTGEIVPGTRNVGFALTTNLGSSNIACASFDDATWAVGTHSLNLQTSNITCGGDFAIGANTTLDDGTAKLTINGASTITTEGQGLPHTILQADTTWVGGSTIARLEVVPGVTVTFNNGETYDITSSEFYDFLDCTLQSDSTGDQWAVTVSAPLTVSGVKVSDSDASGGDAITVVGGDDVGNNDNWVFLASPDAGGGPGDGAGYKRGSYKGRTYKGKTYSRGVYK